MHGANNALTEDDWKTDDDAAETSGDDDVQERETDASDDSDEDSDSDDQDYEDKAAKVAKSLLKNAESVKLTNKQMEDYIMRVKGSRKADRERPEAVATLDAALDAVHKIHQDRS